MASVTLSTPLKFHQLSNSNKLCIRSSCYDHVGFNLDMTQKGLCNTRSLYACNPHRAGSRYFSKPISAVGSGLEASITEDSAITLKKAKIVVESQDDDKMQVRVDVTGVETEKAFGQVLTNLARTAPSIPGFRREKGGKTTNVPKSFLLQILGEDRVTKFVIQEIVISTMADYVKKENLTVKENKINTTQTAEELKKLFTPGNDFGFNAILEFEKTETETDSSEGSSDIEGNDK